MRTIVHSSRVAPQALPTGHPGLSPSLRSDGRQTPAGARYDANATRREQLDAAVRNAGPGAPPGKVIAELSLGSGATSRSARATRRSGFRICTQRSNRARVAVMSTTGWRVYTGSATGSPTMSP